MYVCMYVSLYVCMCGNMYNCMSGLSLSKEEEDQLYRDSQKDAHDLLGMAARMDTQVAVCVCA